MMRTGTLITIVGLVALLFISGTLQAADLSYDKKKVKLKDLAAYPDDPEKAGEIGNKQMKKARDRVKIEHKALMGGAAGWFQDWAAETSGTGTGRSAEYKITVVYNTWDLTITSAYRNINSKMLMDAQAQELIKTAKDEFPLAERFFITMKYTDEFGADADLDNWNVLMFDQAGKRYEPTDVIRIGSEATESLGATYYDATGKEKAAEVVINNYVVTFEKLPEGKEKIELIMAGGSTEDKKLGFRWEFKK